MPAKSTKTSALALPELTPLELNRIVRLSEAGRLDANTRMVALHEINRANVSPSGAGPTRARSSCGR